MSLFNLEAKISLNDKEYREGVEGAKSGLQSLGAFAVAKGQLIADAVKAAGSALIDVGKQAVGGYADYEQLVGGVDTLFKDSSKKVQRYAEEAYMTVGMDANTYMETVTGFSASLLQSLGGDTEKAAEKAHLAMVDMADNANKMGTSLESVRYAYQGFAKGNYTMLDNLKIGYSGTKSEMERLLADAEKLSGVHYDLSSYSDIIDAIHVVQTEMDITGTTAKEASETISGSMAAAKSAFQNLLSGIANGNADIKTLEKKFTKTIKTAAKNLIPVVKTAGKQMIEVLGDLAPDAGRAVGELLGDIAQDVISKVPDILDIAFNTLKGIASGLADSFGIVLHRENEVEAAMYHFSDAEMEIMDNAEQARKKIEELDEAYGSSQGTIQLETEKVQSLWDELQTLADREGRVTNANRERADYIIHQLNEALGTEFYINGNIITQYKDMQKEIDNLIKKRQAERMLAAGEEAYTEKTEQRDSNSRDLYIRGKAIEQNQAALTQKYKEVVDKVNDEIRNYVLQEEQIDLLNLDFTNADEIDKATAALGLYITSGKEYSDTASDISGKISAIKAGYDALSISQSAYANVESALMGIDKDILNYEKAEQAVIAGNYDLAIQYITDESTAKWEALKQGKEISKEEQEELKKDLDYRAWMVEFYYQKLLEGQDGYTKEGLASISKQFEEYKNYYTNHTDDLYFIGQNLTDALASGMKSREQNLIDSTKRMMEKHNASINEYWMIRSPSKKMFEKGQYLDKGFANGIEDGTSDVVRSAEKMSKSAYLGMSGGTKENNYNTTNNRSVGNVTVYVDGSNVSDVDRLAELVADRINGNLMDRSSGYGY